MASKMILVVEDDKALSDALEHKLRSEKFGVLTARNGSEGLELALINKPDLILLDIYMPKMNGVEMLDQLRKDDWGKTVPVLVLTVDIDPEDMHKTLKNNAIDYLIKSDWDLESIVEKIKTKLKI